MKAVTHEGYLQITYRHGRPMAAYYHLPRQAEAAATHVARSREAPAGLVVDESQQGRALGIEITEPAAVTLGIFNGLLDELGFERVTAAELAPLTAA
jgi:hypothetical protein